MPNNYVVDRINEGVKKINEFKEIIKNSAN